MDRRLLILIFGMIALFVISDSFAGFAPTYEVEHNLCPATLLSPLQVQLKMESEAKAVKVDLKELSTEVTADRIFSDHFQESEERVQAAIQKGNLAFFSELVRSKLKQDSEGFDFLWLLGAYPNETVRKAFFQEITRTDSNLLAKSFGLPEDINVRTWLRSEYHPPYLKNDIIMDLSQESRVQPADIQRATFEKKALCAQYSILHLQGCYEALDEILVKMTPRMYHYVSGAGKGEVEISRIDLVNEIIFRDARYTVASKKLAEKLVELVDKNLPPETDFITIARQAFEEVVPDRLEAEDMAWKYIGLYSTLGAEMGRNILALSPKSTDLGFSSYVMASALQVLDSRLHGSGRLFTIPPQFTTNIDTGKPYHFLMSAFLTRELIKKGHSPDAAKSATWLAQVGYQMVSKTKGRNPLRAFMTSKVDYGNLKIRFDLVNAAAGIRFGAGSAKELNPSFHASIDDVFKVSLNQSRESPLLTKDEAEKLLNESGISAYTTWTSIFQPKSIFQTSGLGSW